MKLVFVYLGVVHLVAFVSCHSNSDRRPEFFDGLESEYVHETQHLLSFSDMVVPGRQTDEERLLRSILRGYDAASRPVYNASHTATVDFGLSLVQIQRMDEVNQVLNIYVWLEHAWVDYRLRWDPADYNNLQIFRIPVSLLWVPDIVLYNNADEMVNFAQTRAMLSHDGRIFYGPPVKLRSTCGVDISYYPFDVQRCSLKFGSWTYGGFQLDIHNRSNKMDTMNYVKSGEWDLIETEAVRNNDFYPCCPDEPYPDVTFFIVMRRRPMFYWLNIILPCIWFQLLNVMAFYLPTDSGERVTLIITVLLSYSVFMLLIAEKVPATSDYVPLLGLYLSVAMSLNAISLVFCVLALNLHFGSPFNNRPPPVQLKRLFLKHIATFLRIDTTANWDILQAGESIVTSEKSESKKSRRSLFTWMTPRRRQSLRKRLELFERSRTEQVTANGNGQLSNGAEPATAIDGYHANQKNTRFSEMEHCLTIETGNNGDVFDSPLAQKTDNEALNSDSLGDDVWERRLSSYEQHVRRKASFNQGSGSLKCTCSRRSELFQRRASYCRFPPSFKRQRASGESAAIIVQQTQTEAQMIIKEWRMIAYVVDRCFFYIFMIVSTMATLIILVVIPYLVPQRY